MAEGYNEVIEALRGRSVKTYLQSPDQLVVSRQNKPVLPFDGNSFWVSKQHGA